MLFFKNKTAIVTGSTQGIGKAIAWELCKQGANVVLNGRSKERLEATDCEFRKNGFAVLAVQADVTHHEQCDFLISEALIAFGKIDILINNAGISMNDRFENLLPEVFDNVIRSNIQGSVFPTLKALSSLKITQGSIVFISSVGGMIGLPSASAYSAGKMALTALAQSLKIELSETGIHVGIIYVGFTENEASKRMLNAQGELIPVAKRPSSIQQTQKEVALAVLRNIKKKNFKATLSWVGKLIGFMSTYFPRALITLLSVYQKRLLKEGKK